MAYKGKAIHCKSASHIIEELADWLVNDIGWTDDAPADPTDPNNFIRGHFLRSVGEDGDKDILVHLGVNKNTSGSQFVPCTYLDAAMAATDDEVTVKDIDFFHEDGVSTNHFVPAYIRINDELMLVQEIDVGTSTIRGIRRGLNETTPAAHSSGDVVQIIYAYDKFNNNVEWNGYPVLEIFAARDLVNPIAESSGTIVWAMGRNGADNVTGLDGYGNDRFNCHTLVKPKTGSQAGRIRWVYNYDTTGDFIYQPYQEAPGAVQFEVVSGGWLPGWSRVSRGGGAVFQPGTFWQGHNIGNNGYMCFFYGSKDYFWVGVKASRYTWWQFAGNVIPVADSQVWYTDQDVAAAQNRIHMDSGDLSKFAVGQKYRIISQNYHDWDDNKDRQVGSGWDPLDPEETATEEFVVQSIDSGSSEIVCDANLIYSYKTGAVIGEDPRPMVRNVRYSSGNTIHNSGFCWLDCYQPTEKTEIAIHAGHRQRSRAYHESGDPKTPRSGNPYYNRLGGSFLGALADSSNYNNRQNGQYVLGPVVLEFSQNNETTYSIYGVWNRVKGVLPGVWWSNTDDPDPFSGVAEDTVEGMWKGAMQTFRLLYDWSSDGYPLFFGPEIA